MESMQDTKIDIEMPTSTMTEAVPQAPASLVELVEQMDSVVTTEGDR